MSHSRNSLRIRRMHIRGRGQGTNFRGFSMIELLVVILIIAALIAILVPTLGGSRTAARRAKCLANANGIGQAANLYLEDNRRVYPGYEFDSVQVSETNLLGRRRQNDPKRILNKYVRGSADESGAGTDYIELTAAQCPVDKGDTVSGFDSNYIGFGTSYYYFNRDNADITGGVSVGLDRVWAIEARRATEVTKPTKKLVIADTIIRWDRPDDQKQNQWHSNMSPLEVSIGFADGHAAATKRKTNATGANTATPSATVVEEWTNDPEGYY